MCDDVEYPALSGSTLFPPDGLSMNLGLVVLARLAGEQILGVFLTILHKDVVTLACCHKPQLIFQVGSGDCTQILVLVQQALFPTESSPKHSHLNNYYIDHKQKYCMCHQVIISVYKNLM